MPVKILFRSVVAVNKFRETVFRVAAEPSLSNLLIASGFFQERASYSASFQVEPPVSPSDLRTLLAGKSVELVGVYNNYWTTDFLNFLGSLIGAGAAVAPHIPAGFHWHAKVLMAKPGPGANPTLALIGSSNMTRPAFGPGTPFNFECDVLIWDELHTPSNQLAGRIDFDEEAPPEIDDVLPNVLNLDYAPERNRGLSIGDLLRRLETTILRNRA